MKAILKILLLAGLVMGFHSNVSARPGDKGMHKKIMKQLDISDAQKAQLKKLKEANKTSMDALRANVKSAHDKLDVAFTSGASDAELVTIHNNVVTARGAMGTKRFNNLLEIRKILTPEQRKEFDTLSAKMKQKKKNRKFRHKDKD